MVRDGEGPPSGIAGECPQFDNTTYQEDADRGFLAEPVHGFSSRG
ncbi:hypothetical protein [Nocardia seriolae]|nr:hypothetical protein NSERUTF1_3716 [Nocardia seriolae]